METTVRRWEDGDSVDELTELLHRAYAPWAERGLRFYASHQAPSDTRERMAKGECYVAVVDGRIVGTVTLYAPGVSKGAPHYEVAGVAKLGQLAVDPTHKGRGLGRALLDFAEARARALGATELALDTAEGADWLIDVYARRGYRFVAWCDWRPTTNYRSVLLSLRLDPG